MERLSSRVIVGGKNGKDLSKHCIIYQEAKVKGDRLYVYLCSEWEGGWKRVL